MAATERAPESIGTTMAVEELQTTTPQDTLNGIEHDSEMRRVEKLPVCLRADPAQDTLQLNATSATPGKVDTTRVVCIDEMVDTCIDGNGHAGPLRVHLELQEEHVSAQRRQRQKCKRKGEHAQIRRDAATSAKVEAVAERAHEECVREDRQVVRQHEKALQSLRSEHEDALDDEKLARRVLLEKERARLREMERDAAGGAKADKKAGGGSDGDGDSPKGGRSSKRRRGSVANVTRVAHDDDASSGAVSYDSVDKNPVVEWRAERSALRKAERNCGRLTRLEGFGYDKMANQARNRAAARAARDAARARADAETKAAAEAKGDADAAEAQRAWGDGVATARRLTRQCADEAGIPKKLAKKVKQAEARAVPSDGDAARSRARAKEEKIEEIKEFTRGTSGDEDEARLREELVGTYRKKEVELEHEVEGYRNHDLVRKNSAVFAKYTELRHRLEGLDSSFVHEDGNAGKGMRSETSDVEAKMERELVILREKVRHMTTELQAAQGKGVASAEQFRRRKHELDAKVAEFATNVKLLEKEKQHLEEELERGLHAASNPHGQGMNPHAVKQLQEMQQNMMQQIKDMKVEGNTAEAAELKAEVRRLRTDLREAQRDAKSSAGDSSFELKRLQSENERLKQQAANAPARAAKPMPDFKNAGEAEKRAAELMTRNAIVEEELKSYQEYMKTTLQRHRKEVEEIKKEMRFWRDKAAEKGVSKSAYSRR